MQKKTRGRTADRIESFEVSIFATSAFVSRRASSRDYPDGERSTHLTIEGDLDKPVLKRIKAEISIFEREEERSGLGGAIGVNDTHWQLVVYLAEPQFSHALTLASADRIKRAHIAVRDLGRGKARIIAAGFYTASLPCEAE